jgi:hypothetical protein
MPASLGLNPMRDSKHQTMIDIPDHPPKKRSSRRITLLALFLSLALHIGLWLYLTWGSLGTPPSESAPLSVAVITMPRQTQRQPSPAQPPLLDIAQPTRESAFDLPAPQQRSESVDSWAPHSSSRGAVGSQDSSTGTGTTIPAFPDVGASRTEITEDLHATTTGLSRLMGFEIEDRYEKAAVVGAGKRTTGRTTVAYLDLPADNAGTSAPRVELGTLCAFVNEHTNVLMTPDAAGLSCGGAYAGFSRWLTSVKKRAQGTNPTVARSSAPIDALRGIEAALPFIDDGQRFKAQARVTDVLTRFFAERYRVTLSPLDSNWVGRLSLSCRLSSWEQLHLPGVEEGCRRFLLSKDCDGSELRSLYHFLRLSELMRYPVLFFEPQAAPIQILEENMHLLRAYVNNGGCIYIFNSAPAQTYLVNSNAIRGFIADILQETVCDRPTRVTLDRMQASDRDAAGYEFGPPSPAIFHPQTLFSISLLRTTDLIFSVFTKEEREIYCDTLRSVPAGVFYQGRRGYAWQGVDANGQPVPSGCYIYRFQADLAQVTGPLCVSALRRLGPQHPLFSSYYAHTSPPQAYAIPPTQLPDGEQGVFGVSIDERLAVVYEEGYGLSTLLSSGKPDDRTLALKWLTNVLFAALAEGSLARHTPG